jgi:hypothetical protein
MTYYLILRKKKKKKNVKLKKKFMINKFLTAKFDIDNFSHVLIIITKIYLFATISESSASSNFLFLLLLNDSSKEVTLNSFPFLTHSLSKSRKGLETISSSLKKKI